MKPKANNTCQWVLLLRPLLAGYLKSAEDNAHDITGQAGTSRHTAACNLTFQQLLHCGLVRRILLWFLFCGIFHMFGIKF